MTLKQKAERAVGDVTGGVYKVIKQCVKFMTQARISRAMQRLEAPAVCAGTTQVADELEVLHPEEFVPAGCVRRTRLKTMEWSADVGAGSQATAAAEMQRWA
jgi:hypothetical protein